MIHLVFVRNYKSVEFDWVTKAVTFTVLSLITLSKKIPNKEVLVKRKLLWYFIIFPPIEN